MLTPVQQVETTCSNFTDGRRWCDFCDTTIWPNPQSHKNDCPVGVVLGMATVLLDALRIAEVHIGWGDCSLENVHRIAREAIAKAEKAGVNSTL